MKPSATPLAGAVEARTGALVIALALEGLHVLARVVVRVHQEAVVARLVDPALAGGLDVDRRPVRVREDPVVGGRTGRMEARIDGLRQRAPGEDVSHLEQARDADALVVRRDLVAGDGEPGVVPADADPGPRAEREDDGLPGDPPLDRDDPFLLLGVEVIRVGDEHVPVGRPGAGDHDVAAARRRLGRRQLLDGGGEDRERIEARSLGAVQLFDDPGGCCCVTALYPATSAGSASAPPTIRLISAAVAAPICRPTSS